MDLQLSFGADPGRVFVETTPKDARLKSAITLNGLHPWQPPGDMETWKKRSDKIRRQILVSAGLWPMPPKAPLNPVIHGKMDRDAYTVEKVYFQSYPGFYVTGNLYRPKMAKIKNPAVLSPHGHWKDGRFYECEKEKVQIQLDNGGEDRLAGARFPVQARCAQLARMGCVVFQYDMVGYADSQQIDHAGGFRDVEAELRLQSVFNLQTFNTIRSLDFLMSLDDVDPQRVGVTGASGGGTQTFILMALDSRPAAAFPAVMISDGMQGGCPCENNSHLRIGTSNVEFGALAAPRPYAMTGADDWTRDIETRGLPELKALFKLYGKEEHVEAWSHTQFKHNYNQVSREHMYEWFNKHLGLDQSTPIKEAPFEPVPPAELSVFDNDHKLPPEAVNAGKLRIWMTKTSDQQMKDLIPRDAAGLREFRRVVGGALETMLHTDLPAPADVESETRGKDIIGGFVVRKLILGRKDSGETVPAIYLEPKKFNGVVIVGVSDLGKSVACFNDSGNALNNALNEGLPEILSSGRAVLMPDVFLTGEYLGDKKDLVRKAGANLEQFKKATKHHNAFVGYTYGYNRTLLAQRVHDILTTIAYAQSIPGCKAVHLSGQGQAASWAILARCLSGDAVQKVAVQADHLIDFSSINSFDDPNFLPGAVKYGGMDFFTALCAPGLLRIASRDGVSRVARSAYLAAGKEDAYVVVEPKSDTVFGKELRDWISH